VHAALQGINVVAKSMGKSDDDNAELFESQMKLFAQFFLEHKYANTMDVIYFVLSSLHLCADNAIHIPLIVSVVPPATAALFPTQIKVTNVLDRFANKVKVTLKRATAAASESQILLEDVELPSVMPSTPNNTLFQLPSKSLSGWRGGYYNLQFVVDSQGDDDRFKSDEKIIKRIKVLVDQKPDKLEVVINDSPKYIADKDASRVSYPSQLSKVVVGMVGKFIHFKLQLKSEGASNAQFQPSQVFLQLSKEQKDNKPPKQAIFVFVPTDQHFALKLDLGSVEVSDALSGPGNYSAEVLVGDSLLLRSVTWKVGMFTFPNLANNSALTTKSGAADVFANKAEIHHIFRDDETRPPTIVAFFFTVVVLLPLAGLFLKLMGTPLTLNLPTNPQELLWNLIFQGSILLILLLYVLYWLSLNIFQALACLSVLGLVAIVSGRQALRSLHARSTSHKVKKE